MNFLESITARFKLTQVCFFSSAVLLEMQHVMSIMAWTHRHWFILDALGVNFYSLNSFIPCVVLRLLVHPN